jgi:prolyl-tRNA synthetase
MWCDDRALVYEKCAGLAAALRVVDFAGGKLGVKFDDREGFRPGFKFADWELRGVPLRIEVGPRDIAEGAAVLASRLSGEKSRLSVDFATFNVNHGSITSELEELQAALYQRSATEVQERVFEVGSYDEFRQVIAGGRGFVLAPWDGSAETEASVKEQTGATTRVLDPKLPAHDVKCLFSGQPARHWAYFASSY